jgi:dihydrofolate synthase/folylpolyglutamate synthase
VLEVGLGGRLDSTNVIASPKVCVITSIDYDHCEILGDTLELITGEKAGIIKQGVPVVVGPTGVVRSVVDAKAGELNAPVTYVDVNA